MKVNWKTIEGSRLIELNYDLTRKNSKLVMPKDIDGSIVKVNFVLSRDSYKDNTMDLILEKLRAKKAALVFVGNIKVRDDKRAEETEKSLSLSLSREELVREFAKLYAPERLQEKIVKTALKIMEDSDA